MRIERLTLRNLRSYRSADVELAAGTTLLSGDIGAGKTSLLYAIELALFGFAEVDPQYLVRHQTRDAQVSLTLTDGTHRWELQRRVARKTRKGHEIFDATESALSVDGQRTPYSATELRRWTIELLGFPDNPNPRAQSDVWRWAIYLAQERMRDVLEPDTDLRMDTVRKALGVEQYRLAGENARAVARALRDEADVMAEDANRYRGVEEALAHETATRVEAEREVVLLSAREADLRAQLQRARERLEQLDLRRREAEAQRQSLAYDLQLAEELDRATEADRKTLAAGQDRLGLLVAELSQGPSPAVVSAADPGQLQTLRAHRGALAEQLAEQERLRGEALTVAARLGQWKLRDQAIRGQLESTRRELDKTGSESRTLGSTAPRVEPTSEEPRSLPELVDVRRGLEETHRTAVRNVAAATAELTELAELMRQGVCPRCHRPVDSSEFGAHQKEQHDLVTRLNAELVQAGHAVEAMDRTIEDRAEYERALVRWNNLEGRRIEVRAREAALRERAAAEEAMLSQQSTELQELEAQQGRLSGLEAERGKLREQLDQVDRDVEAAEQRLQFEAARRERLAALDRQLTELRSDLATRETSVRERTARREQLGHRIATQRDLLAASGDVRGPWEVNRAEVDALQSQVEAVVRDSSRPRTQAAGAAARIEELARRRQERDQIDRRATDLRSLATWVDGPFRETMLELERRRLQEGRQRFERRLAQYFAALVEDPSLVARVDDAFGPWVDIAGQPTPAEALSGGERTALALAYRLALGRTVRDAGHLRLDTLILDEPTEGFSQEQTLRMGDLLETLGLPQVLLVSHEPQLEGIADRVIRVRKKDGVSTVEGTGPLAVDPTLPTPAAASQDAPVTTAPRRRRIRRLTDLAPAEGDAPHAK